MGHTTYFIPVVIGEGLSIQGDIDVVRIDRVDDPPMVTPVGFDDDSDTACT